MSEAKGIESLSAYSLLGNSGLRVSPLCLGTMTFGTDWGWGAAEAASRAILDRYLEAGGNFVDTADIYTSGTSETFLGKFLKERGDRDRVVIASKFTFNSSSGDPNAGGNSRKNVYRALEGSLRRLQTDYLDLYWLHAWDGLTPAEEVVSTLDDLVRAGKVRYVGLSDTPAWYLARAQTIAEWRGFERVAGLQLEYSLVERNIEREFVPAAIHLGMGICAWSPLASGMLTGKYRRSQTLPEGEGRLMIMKSSPNPGFTKLFRERNWKIADGVAAVARELGRSPAQISINWIARRPGVASTILGATKPEQLEDNLHALDFEIPAPLSRRLEELSRPETMFPYYFFEAEHQRGVTGGTTVLKRPRSFFD